MALLKGAIAETVKKRIKKSLIRHTALMDGGMFIAAIMVVAFLLFRYQRTASTGNVTKRYRYLQYHGRCRLNCGL
jgi:hypothetical protein